MATEDRTSDHTLNEIKAAQRFSFFQLVHLLERYYQPAARIGRQGPASKEVIRFRPDASLGFPVSDVLSVEMVLEAEVPQPRFIVTTGFLGLFGTTSPLPIFYTEEILWAAQEEGAVQGFINIFHHRLLSLFYRCWSKYRYHVQFELEGRDEISHRMFGLIGLGTSGLVENTGLSSVRLIRYTGLINQQPRSASALEGILSDFFDDLPVRVEQCTGRWVTIGPEQRNFLGQGNCRLGIDCSIGERVHCRSGGFRISVGPMVWGSFIKFLPDQENAEMLNSLVKFFVRDRLDFEIELSVYGRDIPPLQLKSIGGVQLGWTSWLSPGSLGEERILLRQQPSALRREEGLYS